MLDVHAHVVLPETFGALGDLGPTLSIDPGGAQCFRVGGYELVGVKYAGSVFMDVGMRLAAMEAAGITHQVLSPNPLTYAHHVEAAAADRLCKASNDALAELVRAHPDRLSGFVALPAQDPERAAAELRRGVRDLGLRGGYLGTDPGGRTLDDPALDVLWATAVELDVPMFVHPAPSGIDGPLIDGRTRRFDLDLLLWFAYEESLAVAAFVFGGVLHRFPGLDVCISHGGGTIGFLAGRWRLAARTRPWSPPWLKDDPAMFDTLLRRLWFDVHVHDTSSLWLLADAVGPQHLVYGTNFGGWDAAGHVDIDAVDADLEANARRLLRM